VVLEGKQIKELGSHEELIKEKGLYWRLYTVQKQLDAQGEMAVSRN
jgi:ABC-type multidrug transport system fused ATPase/permease subunit